MSAGIDPRGKKKTEIPLVSHCTSSNRIGDAVTLCWNRKLTSVNTATDAVETFSVSRVGFGSYATALVGSGADGAVRATDESPADGQCLGICTGKAATRVGMECRLIVRIVIHSLDDIDLASGRPIWTCVSISTDMSNNRDYIYHYSKRLAMYRTRSACVQHP